MFNRVRKFLAADGAGRWDMVRQRASLAVDWLVFDLLGRPLNHWSSRVYLSYIPDSIRAGDRHPEHGSLLRFWVARNKRNNYGDMGRFFFMLQNARRVIAEGIQGDFAEIGVYKGNSAKILWEVLRLDDPERHLHLFDTFEGFDERDLVGVDATRPRAFTDVSLSAVQAFIQGDERCRFYPGRFPDSAASLDPFVRFAFVHVDCDLYEPIRNSLEFFYPRLTPGGMLVIHDYSSGQWPGATKAVDEFFAGRPEKPILLPDKSGTVVFRKH